MNTWSLCNVVYALLWHLGSCESPSSNNVVQPDLDCAFEDGLCGWQETSENRRLTWTVNRKGTRYVGPEEDHTTGHGFYLAIRTVRARMAGKASLTSPPIITSEETCLTFWYCMYGYSIGSLHLYRIGEGNEKTKLFSMSGPQGPPWYRADVQTGEGAFKLEIEATFPWHGDFGDIAIDDITFTYQPCKEQETGITKDEPQFDCDFEDDFCSWTAIESRSLWWRKYTVSSSRKQGDTPPPRSNGTSYINLYRYRSGRKVETELRSPALSLDNDACMTFWFKLQGKMASGLFVRLLDYWQNPLFWAEPIFYTVKKTEGWVQALVTLPKVNHSLVAITGVSDRWSYGKISIDDIRLTHNGPCPKGNQERLVNCDFERDLCRWYITNSETTEGNWLRTKDPTPTNGTGPSHDHSGDGYYIFLDAADVEEAKLHSALFNVSDDGACLSFWYYMYGEDVYRLELVYKSFGHDSEVIWSLEGSQNDTWLQQNVSLPSSPDVDLLFTAKRGYFPKGDIALDDINISFGAPCGNEIMVPTTTAPSSVILEETTLPTTTHTTAPATSAPPSIKPPQLIVIGEINPAYEKSRVELICQFPDPSWMTTWYQQKESPLPDENVLHEIYDFHGASRLVFDDIQVKDKGTYLCQVARFNQGETESHKSDPVKIDVVSDRRASPLLEAEGDVGVFDGQFIELEVNAVVKLACGRAINGGLYHWTTTSSAFTDSSLPNTRILVLNDTKPEHSGVYSCSISKDGFTTREFTTRESNALDIAVIKGRKCKYDDQCLGEAYKFKCDLNHRCRCSSRAVLDGRACKLRPKRPSIVTSPGFHEFGIGESFYLICKPSAPLLSNSTFTFIHLDHSNVTSEDQLAVSPFRIMQISDASEKHSGRYACYITYGNVQSYFSDEINVQVRDFINLSCDFANGFCGWSLGNDIGTTEFVAASRSSDEDDSTQKPSGTFIQLVESETNVPNRAILVSPTIGRMTLDSCLSFWYRMNGPDVHSLTLWKFSSKGTIHSHSKDHYVGTEIWTVVGERGNDWIRQNVTIEKGNDFYITFDAIGQAAIDDVIFTYRGGCE